MARQTSSTTKQDSYLQVQIEILGVLCNENWLFLYYESHMTCVTYWMLVHWIAWGLWLSRFSSCITYFAGVHRSKTSTASVLGCSDHATLGPWSGLVSFCYSLLFLWDLISLCIISGEDYRELWLVGQFVCFVFFKELFTLCLLEDFTLCLWEVGCLVWRVIYSKFLNRGVDWR